MVKKSKSKLPSSKSAAHGPTAPGAIQQLSPRFVLVGVLAVGLLLRLVYIHLIRADVFSKVLVIDAKFYDEWAQRILQGDWLGHEVFYQDPLYAYFLAVCYKFFGHDINIVRVVQALLDIGTIASLYAIGAILFTPWVGIWAAVTAAFYGPMIYYTGLLDKTTFSTFLVALSLASFVYASKQFRTRWLLLSGGIFGLAALTRGNLLIVVLGLGAWLCFRQDTVVSRLRRATMFVCGASMIVGLVTLRNLYVGKDFVLLTSNAGLNFLIGNNPYTAGTYIEPSFIYGIPEEEYSNSKAYAEAVLHKKLTKASEVSAFYFRQGLSFVIGSPIKWLILLGKKMFLAVNRFEVLDTYSFYYFKAIERTAATRSTRASSRRASTRR